jgi:hypothetical protein
MSYLVFKYTELWRDMGGRGPYLLGLVEMKEEV